MKTFGALLLLCLLASHHVANAAENYNWGIGAFGGKFYNSSPEDFLTFKDSKFLDHYILGITADRTVWRAQSYPLSVQIEGLLAYQFGKDSYVELGVAPRITWSGFPWNDYVYTRFRVAPVGLAITSSRSKLEREKGDGEHLLYYCFFEVAFSPPKAKENELFVRLHHRCTFFGQLSNKKINGEDFFIAGFRRNF